MVPAARVQPRGQRRGKVQEKRREPGYCGSFSNSMGTSSLTSRFPADMPKYMLRRSFPVGPIRPASIYFPSCKKKTSLESLGSTGGPSGSVNICALALFSRLCNTNTDDEVKLI